MDGHRTIRAWFDAFNQRDVDGMLRLTAPDVELHPLRTAGYRRRYVGHKGIRDWMAELDNVLARYVVDVRDIRTVGRHRLLAFGRVGGDGTPFVGLHEVVDGRINAAQHFLSDVETIERVGRAV